MYHYYLTSGEEVGNKKEALTCPECGESEDIDYNIDSWSSEPESRCTFREYNCLCNKCKTLFDFQETKLWDED